MHDSARLQEIRELMGEAYGTLVRTYVTNADTVLDRLDSAAAPDEELLRIVHSLKSSSRYMGAMQVGTAAENLEQALRAGQKELHPLIAEFRARWLAARGFYASEAS